MDAERVRIAATIHPHDPAERACPPGFDPGSGVLEHGRVLGLQIEQSCGREEHVRRRLPPQPTFGRDETVDDHLEELGDACSHEDLAAVAARRHHRAS